MATLPGLRVGLTLDSATFIAETRRVNDSVNRLGRNVAQQTTQMQRGFTAVSGAVKGTAAALGALVTVAAAARLGSLAKDALDAAGNLGEMATAAGVTTRQLQALQVAGVQVGVSSEQMVRALSQFGVRVGEAQQGTGELVDTLERYGIATKNSAGQVRSSIDILGDLANAVQRAGSEQERLSIVADAFGARVGPKLLPLLTEGAAGFRQWAEAAEAAGLILDDEFIAAADRASDGIATLQFAVAKGFEIGVVKAFAAEIQITADNLKSAREAGEFFGRAIGNAMEIGLDAVRSLQPFLETTAREFRAIADIVQRLFEFTGSPFNFAAAADEVEALNDRLSGFGDELSGTGAGAVALSEDLQTAIDKLKIENATLEDSIRLYGYYDEATASIASKIAIENAIREEKITKQEAERIGLLGLLLTNEQYKASLEAVQAARSAFEEGQALQIEIDAQGRVTEELRVQIALLKVKQNLGEIAADAVEDEIRATEQLRSQLANVNAARGIQDTIEQQRLLIRFGAEETEEYRVQLRLLELKRDLGAEAAAGMEAQVRLLEQQTTHLETAGEAQELLDETFKNFLRSVQSETANTFETILSGGVTTFKDLFEQAKQLVIRFAAEAAALLVFNPRMVLGAAGAFGVPGAAGAAGAPSLASQLGGGFFGGGVANPAAGGVRTGPGGLLVGGGVTSSAGVPASGFNFDGAGFAGGGLAGFGVGTTAGGLIGGNQTNAAIGSAAGAIAGGVIGSIFPVIGTALGAFAGGAIGGLIGGFIGGGGEERTKGSFSGGIGVAKSFGDESIGKVVKQIDSSILALLDSRQRSIAQAVKSSGNISVGGGLSESDIGSIASERIGAVAGALGFKRGAVLRGDTDQALKNLETAIATQRAIEDLTGAVSPFDRQLEELDNQFRNLTDHAKQFGIATTGLAEAQAKATEELLKSQDAQLAALLDPFTALSGPLEAFKTQLEFAGLNPAQQFQRAQADFQRISGLAQGGDVAAIGQLRDAGQLFVDLADRVGASALAASARSEVSESLNIVTDKIAAAQQSASEGIEDAIDRARRENSAKLDELVEEIKRLVAETKRGRI